MAKKDGIKPVRLLVINQDEEIRKKWGRLSPDGTHISYPYVRPNRTYMRDRLARKWWPTFWNEAGLSKGKVECYVVYEEWAQPIIFNPHEIPIHNFAVGKPSYSTTEESKVEMTRYQQLLEKSKRSCIACSNGSLYSLVPSHKVHEFKHNKVERGLVEESARMDDNKSNWLQIGIFVIGCIVVLFLALVLWSMGILDLETWTQPRNR